MSWRSSRTWLLGSLGLSRAAIAAVGLMGCFAVSATAVRVEVVTRILPFDPQAGMKSSQILLIDFDKKRVEQSFSTGVTGLGSAELGSVRDKFVVENVDFTASGRVGMTVSGQTASGVLFMPNINYRFYLAVTPAGKGAMSGCHDGYPAYSVKVGTKTVYDFEHQPLDLARLFGECDIEIKQLIDF